MASTTPMPSGFQRVMAKFSSRLTPAEAQDFQFTTLNDVHQIIVDIQEQQARRKSMRNLTRVLRFVEAMDEFGKVVEVFLNSSALLPFIWGPLKFLLQMTSAWAESFDILLDAYQQIADNIPLLLQYQSLFEQSPPMSKVLEMIYEDILEFHRSALRMFGKSTFQSFFRAAWKDYKSRFSHILDDLQHHKCLIESQANILQIQQTQAARTMAQDAFEKIFLAQRNDQYLALQNWLGAVNMRDIQEGFSNIRREYPSTGQWICRNETIKLWMDSQSSAVPAVWISGIPGAGKTILTSLLIEQAQQIPLVSVLFFYCKHKDPQRTTFVGIVRAILAQVLVKLRDDDLLPFLYQQYLDSGETSLSSLQLCSNLLSAVFENMPQSMKVYIVIDGIDECDSDERRKILSTFSSIATNAKYAGQVRDLFVSQDEPDIKKMLQAATKIKITESDNEEDIKYYVSHWASKITEKFGLPSDQTESMIKTACLGADGMFLFVKLVMSNLYNQTTRKEMYNELLPERFPKGLDQAYERVVERIYRNNNEAEREKTQKLLGWLVCSRRPLKWHEIQGAMSIDLDLQTVDFEEGKLILDAEELCGSLVERFPGGRIELVHSTAKTYLVQGDYIRLPQEEGRLAALCLQYLTFESFANESQSDETISRLIKTGFYAFLDYASLHWVDHLEIFLRTMEAVDLRELDIVGQAGEDFSAVNHAFDIPDVENVEQFDVRCVEARDAPCFESLVSLATHTRRMRSTQEDLLALGDVGAMLARVRSHFESMVQSSRLTAMEKQSLEMYYGGHWFKCSRHACFYFHEGFPAAKNRDQHLNRHELPFCCSHDGCSRAQTGFSTEKELQKHTKKNHPDPQSLSWRFAKADTTVLGSKQKPPARFQCTRCVKRFTRGFALKCHLRAHTGERPFVCTFCQGRFARQQDFKRHERLHSGEKRFVCKGELKLGGQWGCGRRFARADGLGKHFRSEAGRICINPLLDEEAEARQSQRERDTSNPANLNPMPAGDLPEALLAQYPALAGSTEEAFRLEEGTIGQEEQAVLRV
ncbi:hypothetical protein BP6252_02864 [Coleophoma cylindrospora]|uniref:C2H2-type domain-containing protein n=1 Tax=Coleophoma cylindrospora TaxID=1849047 RepID=A0A3D8SGK0_9HELO|nr:hypothetical protein BP6252_02864 [Coleophoma cylindrospora]